MNVLKSCLYESKVSVKPKGSVIEMTRTQNCRIGTDYIFTVATDTFEKCEVEDPSVMIVIPSSNSTCLVCYSE